MKKTDTSYIVFDSIVNALVCKHCEETHKMIFPIDVKLFSKQTNAFIKLHEDCKPKES